MIKTKISQFIAYFFSIMCLMILLSNQSWANECQNWQTTHPDWIFCDDFEDGTALVRPGRYFEVDSANGNFTLTNGVGYNGSKGMKALWTTGAIDAGALHLAFGRNPGNMMTNGIKTTSDYKEIFYRTYVKMQNGFTGNPVKLSRATVIAKPDWSQAMIGHLWAGSTSYLAIDPASCISGNTVKCSGYNDFNNLSWLGNQNGSTTLFDGNHNNSWYCIESHVKLNDAGQANGVQEFWIDGNLETRKTGLNFVGSYTAYGINAVFFENHWNSGSPKQQERYFDNIVVSTQRIGCNNSIIPNPPQNLRIIK